jgi:PAS domain S-box-containing protein
VDFDQDFLKTLTVLYVEDDSHARTSLSSILVKLFKKVYITEDGAQGFEYFQKFGKDIDVVVSDINMPNMTGMEMLEAIREIDSKVAFIFTTAHQENDFLLGAIRHGVYHYANKPVDIKEIVFKVQEACQVQYEHTIAKHNYKEAQSYLNVINQVAIVSKADLMGDITYVNDMFCNITGYDEDELLGQSQNIIRHPDTSLETFQDLWTTIRSGERWNGKLKNLAKDGDPYFVNANIFPIYDDFDSEIIGFMSIQFLTTSEENEKREYKAHIRQMTLDQKKSEMDLRKQISILEKKLHNGEYIDILEENSKAVTTQNKKLKQQMDYYEDKIRNFEHEKLEIKKAAKEHFFNVTEENRVLGHKNSQLEKQFADMEKTIEKQKQEIYRLNEELNTQSRVVVDLKDVIEHREDQLAKYEKMNR